MASSVIKSQSIPIRYEDITYTGTYTMGASNFCELGTVNGNVLSAFVRTWSSNTGAFSLAYSSNRLYLVGNSGTKVTDLAVRVLYI